MGRGFNKDTWDQYVRSETSREWIIKLNHLSLNIFFKKQVRRKEPWEMKTGRKVAESKCPWNKTESILRLSTYET